MEIHRLDEIAVEPTLIKIMENDLYYNQEDKTGFLSIMCDLYGSFWMKRVLLDGLGREVLSNGPQDHLIYLPLIYFYENSLNLIFRRLTELHH